MSPETCLPETCLPHVTGNSNVAVPPGRHSRLVERRRPVRGQPCRMHERRRSIPRRRRADPHLVVGGPGPVAVVAHGDRHERGPEPLHRHDSAHERCGPRLECVASERHERAPAADVGGGAPVDDVLAEAPELHPRPDVVEGLRPQLPELARVVGRRETARENPSVLVDERDVPRDVALTREAIVPVARSVVPLTREGRVVEVGVGSFRRRRARDRRRR